MGWTFRDHEISDAQKMVENEHSDVAFSFLTSTSFTEAVDRRISLLLFWRLWHSELNTFCSTPSPRSHIFIERGSYELSLHIKGRKQQDMWQILPSTSIPFSTSLHISSYIQLLWLCLCEVRPWQRAVRLAMEARLFQRSKVMTLRPDLHFLEYMWAVSARGTILYTKCSHPKG